MILAPEQSRSTEVCEYRVEAERTRLPLGEDISFDFQGAKVRLVRLQSHERGGDLGAVPVVLVKQFQALKRE